MWFFSWLRNQTSIWFPRRRAPRFRPQLEALEDRCLPSTLTVTSDCRVPEPVFGSMRGRTEKNSCGQASGMRRKDLIAVLTDGR
jgi:hypothetical protein